jgi:hypothetical protein
MEIFETLVDLSTKVGQKVGVSDWIVVTQAQIAQFALATGDHQWFHVVPERARSGPFGTPIAHGFLTLSLLPQFFENALQIRQVQMAVNYGLNRVRFVAPVPVNSRLRAHLTLVSIEPIDHHGMQLLWGVSVEREGASKPVCVAEFLVRYYGPSGSAAEAVGGD